MNKIGLIQTFKLEAGYPDELEWMFSSEELSYLVSLIKADLDTELRKKL